MQTEMLDSLIEGALNGTLDANESQLLDEEQGDYIYAAAASASSRTIERLVAGNSNLATIPGGPRNWPPLLYVSYSKEVDDKDAARCAQLLLEHGADPDSHFYDPAYPDSPQSALYGAVGVNNNPLLADVLLRHGAHTQDGESIYHAAQHGHLECLEVLRKHGADFSAAQQPWGNTPLYFLLGHRPSDQQWPIAFKGVRWLLEEGGADPKVTSYDYEETPLHLAARRHRAEVVELLLAHGAHADQPTRDGLTPYAVAARNGNIEAMEALRRHGAGHELSRRDELLAACALGDAQHAAGILAGEPELLKSLGPRDLALLGEHAAEGNLLAVSAMCQAGFPLDAQGEMCATALHHAAWYGQEEVARVLVEHGAPLDLKDGTYQGTPLDWACHGSLFCQHEAPGQHSAVARLLIEHGSPLPDEDWGSEEVKEILKAARRL